MVSKNATLITKKSTTTNAVPAAGALQPAELAINLADRKLYSKDASNNVFQIAGEAGRDVGDYVKYENFLGFGYQGIGVKADGRVWFKRDKDKKAEFTTVWMTKKIDVDAQGPDATGSVAVLRVDETINRGDLESFHFLGTFNLNYEPLAGGGSGGAGQHVAIYPRVDKRGQGNLWAICGEMRDYTDSPTTASVGQEITLLATGADPNNQRIGLHLSMNSAFDTNGSNIWSHGLVIGGPIAKVQAKNFILLQGAAKVGIDLTQMETGYADVGVRMRSNQTMVWADDYASTTERGGIRWSSVVNTFQFGGVPVSLGAASAADRKMLLNISGYNYYINLTPA